MGITKLNWLIKGTSLLRVPLLSFCNPKLIALEPKSQVFIPLNFVTKNHVRTMYFGALAMGAELSVAVPILNAMFIEKKKISFIFKNVKCEFLKRADTDVIFEYASIDKSRELIEKALQSGERENLTCPGLAYSSKNPENVFMTYEITVSVKKTT